MNINELIPNELVTAYVASRSSRLVIDSGRYKTLKKPIIMPLSRIHLIKKTIFKKSTILDYGLSLKDEAFQILDNGCILDTSLTINYAISVATASGANQILLTGIDGYEESDPRQLEMLSSIDRYNSLPKSLPIFCSHTN